MNRKLGERTLCLSRNLDDPWSSSHDKISNSACDLLRNVLVMFAALSGEKVEDVVEVWFLIGVQASGVMLQETGRVELRCRLATQK